jgi:hypothetical protein
LGSCRSTIELRPLTIQQNQVLLLFFDPIFVSHHCVIVMSADYPGPLSIDRSSVTRQVKRAHLLIDRNAIYPMIPPRGIGDGGRSMVAKLERVALREALPQRVVECAGAW